MQFTQSKDAYLLHRKDSSSYSKSTINSKSTMNFGYQEETLIGGGKVRVLTTIKSQPIFLSNLLNLKAKTISIEFDESSIT